MQNKRKLLFTSVLETIHGLGVSGWVSYLLSKIALAFIGKSGAGLSIKHVWLV
ncbi:hypothetical protein EDE11_1144 [Methylomonas methanica]|nr:hypothetical protein EDE11_1144 [Methylomonas methanica]